MPAVLDSTLFKGGGRPSKKKGRLIAPTLILVFLFTLPLKPQRQLQEA
jgi:hypothetical protein